MSPPTPSPRAALLAALLAATAAVATAQQQQPTHLPGVRAPPSSATSPTTATGGYIVKLRRSALARGGAPADIALGASRGRGRVRSARGHGNAALRSFVALQADAAAAAALAGHPDVESVEPDAVVYAAALHMAPLPAGASAPPSGGALRGARSLAVRSGWNPALDRSDQRGLPLDGSFNATLDGSGVDIFVLDSGINPAHVEFAGRVATDLARNFVTDAGSPLVDCLGHGTFVASQAAGATVGVASGARIVPLRVFDCTGAATVSALLSAVDYAVTTRASTGRPGVINFSGSGGVSATMDSLAAAAGAGGLLWVDAAGNDRADACTRSPGRAPGGLTVGASFANDTYAGGFSNAGPCVNITAVGVDNVGAWPASTSAYAQGSGTSFSAPVVAGISALAWQALGATAPADAVLNTVLFAASPDELTGVASDTANLLAYALPGGLTPDVALPTPSNSATPTPSRTAAPTSATATPTRSGATASPTMSRSLSASPTGTPQVVSRSITPSRSGIAPSVSRSLSRTATGTPSRSSTATATRSASPAVKAAAAGAVTAAGGNDVDDGANVAQPTPSAADAGADAEEAIAAAAGAVNPVA